MTDFSKPLAGDVRAAASLSLGALCRTATASRELAESGDDYFAASLLEDITAMEAILDRLRQVISHA